MVEINKSVFVHVVFVFLALVFCSLVLIVVVFGWDVGLTFTYERAFLEQYTYVLHLRSGLIFVGLGIFALHKFRKIFDGSIAVYLTFVIVFACYGITELMIDIANFVELYISFALLAKESFYWFQYLFQLFILYIFAKNPHVRHLGHWKRNGWTWIAGCLGASIFFFMLAHWNAIPALTTHFRVPETFYINRYFVGFFFKLFAALAFASYVHHWQVIT